METHDLVATSTLRCRLPVVERAWAAATAPPWTRRIPPPTRIDRNSIPRRVTARWFRPLEIVLTRRSSPVNSWLRFRGGRPRARAASGGSGGAARAGARARRSSTPRSSPNSSASPYRWRLRNRGRRARCPRRSSRWRRPMGKVNKTERAAACRSKRRHIRATPSRTGRVARTPTSNRAMHARAARSSRDTAAHGSTGQGTPDGLARSGRNRRDSRGSQTTKLGPPPLLPPRGWRRG